MPKTRDPYLISRKIDSLDKEQLADFIDLYRKRVNEALAVVRRLAREVVKRQDASAPVGILLARGFSNALAKMMMADRRLREAEERLDFLNYGDGRKEGNVLRKRDEWIFGTDLAKELEKDQAEEKALALEADDEEMEMPEDSEEEEKG